MRVLIADDSALIRDGLAPAASCFAVTNVVLLVGVAEVATRPRRALLAHLGTVEE